MEQILIETELDSDNKIIPFNEVVRLLNFFPKGNNKRVALMWLALTGGRPCEIENRSINELVFNQYWVWKPRKKQTGFRREKLPEWFINELNYYMEKSSYSNNNLFGINGESLARYINKFVRSALGGGWLKKKPQFKDDGTYRLIHLWQLKHLRHNYQTFKWAQYADIYGGDVALSKVSRKMRHSSIKITGKHYIEDVNKLNYNKYKHQTLFEILKQKEVQHNLLEYF